MNNILINILKLRDKLKNSGDVGQKIVNSLFGDNDFLTGTISDGLGSSLSISGTAQQMVCHIIKSDGSDSSLFEGTYDDFVASISDIVTDGSSAAISSSGFDVATFIQNANYGNNMNMCLASILDKFAYSSKLPANDLVNLINNSGLDGVNRSELVNALSSAADEQGFISNFCFIQMLNSISQASKQAIENGSPTIDSTEIFYLRNFLATAVTAIATTLTSLLSVLLSSVNVVLGFITSIIGSVVANIAQAIGGNLDSEVSVSNITSTTTWFNGPVLGSVYENPEYVEHIYDNDFIAHNQVVLNRFGNIDTALWPTDNYRKWSVNAFVSLALHRDKAWDWLMTYFSVEGIQAWSPDSPVTITLLQDKPILGWNFPESCYLTDDEIQSILRSQPRTISDYIINALGATLFLACMQQLTHAGDKITMVLEDAFTFDQAIGNLQVYAQQEHYAYLYMFSKAIGIFAKCAYNHFTHPEQGWNADWANDELTVIALELNKVWTPISDSQVGRDRSNPFKRVAGNVAFHNSTHATFTYPSGREWDNSHIPSQLSLVGPSDHKTYIVNCVGVLSSVPTDRMFTFASYSNTKLALVAAASAVIIGLTVAGVCLAKKAWTERKWSKMLVKKQRLMDARNAWAEGALPTHELYKMQKRYNFQAKLFGWDTFDVSNGWWNSPSIDGTASPSANTSDILQEVKALISG